MSDTISKERFAQLINEYIREGRMKQEDEQVWVKDDTRWIDLTEAAQKFFLGRLAKKYTGYLGYDTEPDYLNTVSPAIASLTTTFFMALSSLRRHSIKTGTDEYSLGYVYETIKNKLNDEIEKGKVGGITHALEKRYKVVAKNGICVYSQPGAQDQVCGILEYGKTIKVMSISKGWAKFMYNRKTAYVSAEYLEKASGLIMVDIDKAFGLGNSQDGEDEASEFESSIPRPKNNPSASTNESMDNDMEIWLSAVKVFEGLSERKDEARLYVTFNMLNQLKCSDRASINISNEKELLRFFDTLFISFCMRQELGIPFKLSDWIGADRFDSLDSICDMRYGYYHRIDKEKAPYRNYEEYLPDTPIAEFDDESAAGEYYYKELEQAVVKSYIWARDHESWNVSDRFNRNNERLKKALLSNGVVLPKPQKKHR